MRLFAVWSFVTNLPETLQDECSDRKGKHNRIVPVMEHAGAHSVHITRVKNGIDDCVNGAEQPS